MLRRTVFTLSYVFTVHDAQKKSKKIKEKGKLSGFYPIDTIHINSNLSKRRVMENFMEM